MTKGADQYCPIARAADILSQRWTMLILRDLHAGCRRFNQLRRGVPKMSPSLLSQRLKNLEREGLISRVETEGGVEYDLTEAGRETLPIVQLFGIWGHRWLHHRMEPEHLDEGFLLYAISCGIDRSQFRGEQTVLHFLLDGDPPPAWPRWWMIVTPEEVDACVEDPGFEVDLFVESDVRTLYRIMHGVDTIAAARREGRLEISGDERLRASFSSWYGNSPYAGLPKPGGACSLVDLLSSLGVASTPGQSFFRSSKSS